MLACCKQENYSWNLLKKNTANSNNLCMSHDSGNENTMRFTYSQLSGWQEPTDSWVMCKMLHRYFND